METFVNSETCYRARTFTEIGAIHQKFWRARAKKTELQLEDGHLANEAFIEAMEQRTLPLHNQKSFDSLLDRAEARRERALIWLRQENGRRGGKSRKSDRLQGLVEEIVAKYPKIDCPTLLRLLSNKQGAGVIEDVDEEEIAFIDAKGQLKSAEITGLKDRLYRAKKKVESHKAVHASQH
jgi:hypothetical protein